MESPMEEAYRRLVQVITTEPDDKQTEEHIHNLIVSLPSVLQTKDAQARTPLHHAAMAGKPLLLRAILGVTFPLDLDPADAEGLTPLHHAARLGHTEAVHALLRAGASVLREEAFGETPLHEAARHGHDDLVRLFVDAGAVVDAGNRDASTALHVAARRGHCGVVDALLAAGANPATRDKVGDTPLHDAAREGHADIVAALLATGAVGVDARNANGLTPLSVAARHGREAIVRSLLERGADVDAPSSEFCTPLHQAAAEGHDGVARALIAAGADVDLRDRDEQSPLHAAVIFEHAAVAGSLLAAGAAVDPRDTEDCTPLHHAVKNGSAVMVRDLLEAGADTTVLSAGGETPQSLARVLGKEAVVDLFASPQVVPRQDVAANFRPRRARGPSRPSDEAEADVCRHFRATLWSPSSEATFDEMSVWDLLYDADAEVKLSPSSGLAAAAHDGPSSPVVSFAGKERLGDVPHQYHHQQEQSQRHHHAHQHDRRKASSSPRPRPPPPVKRWVHLPANNVSWVLDLVQKLSAVDGKTEAECARIMRFVRDTFLEMRFSAPYRKPHFRREAAGGVMAEATGPGMEHAKPHGGGGGGGGSTDMFSLVLPVIDVDMDEGSRLQLQAAGGGSADVPARELLRAGTEERHRSLRAMPTNLQHYLFPYLKHLGAMVELRRCFNKSELHVPRTLDQSYHESLTPEEVRQRSESQVLYRYLRRLDEALAAAGTAPEGAQAAATSASAAGKQASSGQTPSASPFEHRELLSEVSSEKQKRTDGTKEQLMRMAGRQDVASSVRARAQREVRGVGVDTVRRRQVLMVSQLWMWRLDEHNVVTCYPERWDDKNAKTLLNDMKHRLRASEPRGGVGGGDDDDDGGTDMMARVAAHLLSAATAFGDEEFHFQFAGPRSYANAFAGSVARVSDEVMKRYTRFEAGIRGMRTSRTVLGDLRAEIALLQEMDDVGEEIIMVQRVLGEQARVAAEFGAADGEVAVLPGAPPAVGFFERLGMDAARVRLSITTLLDLRQREANIEEALSANEQSKILFIFTGATVVFAPLSWIMGVFEVNISGLPDPISPGFAAAASLGSLLATIVVIWLSLQVFELITRGTAATERPRLDSLLRKRRQRPDGKSSASVTSAPGLSPQRSSAPRSEAAAAVPGPSDSGGRKLRKRYMFLGRDGRQQDDEHTAAGAV